MRQAALREHHLEAYQALLRELTITATVTEHFGWPLSA